MSITIPDVIRRTYIETYRSCPHKFFKEVIEGNAQPPTSYTQLGIDLHELFEEACYWRINEEDALEEMRRRFEAYSDDLFTSGFASDNRHDMWNRTVKSIEVFFKQTLPNLPKNPFITEQTIEFSVGDDLPRVQFTMDRIDEVDGELEMHDWKTGRVLAGQKLSSDLQAPLYLYGTREHFKKPVRSFTFHYVNEAKMRQFVRSQTNPDEYICTVGKREYKINLTDGIRTIQSVFSQIKKENFNIPHDTKKMHFACKVCHLKKQGICEGADLQQWNQAGNGKYAW